MSYINKIAQLRTNLLSKDMEKYQVRLLVSYLVSYSPDMQIGMAKDIKFYMSWVYSLK